MSRFEPDASEWRDKEEVKEEADCPTAVYDDLGKDEESH